MRRRNCSTSATRTRITTSLERWIDYLAFALSGLPADGTVGAAVAYTLGDLHRPNAVLDYPVGGSGAVCEAPRGLHQ